ncbi:hypothetical protein M422DRAFT_155394 [Sphaerobolus stellatus SS14]|nr:hypothetical protein M422DRAFT_155394 [Sphaerobolus stellatus SS14]
MHQSDFFSQYEDNLDTAYWTEYERVAKQMDEDFLERYNSDLDVQLIFAGLFSAVSSTFIVQMEGALQPDPNTTTNTLLAFLIQQIGNDTSLPIVVQAALQPWDGPGSSVLWTQSLGYLSLGLSLLAGFGAVQEKQWLGHFKTSRLGYGTR